LAGITPTGYGMEEVIRRSREAGLTTHRTNHNASTMLEAPIRQVAR
jgi:hypothetical protein